MFSFYYPFVSWTEDMMPDISVQEQGGRGYHRFFLLVVDVLVEVEMMARVMIETW